MFGGLDGLLSALLGTGVLLFGVFSIGFGVRRLVHQTNLRRLSTTDTGDVTDSGMVAVQGTIQGPVATALESPFEQTTGILTKWKIEEFAGHELGTGDQWSEMGTGYQSVPFVVDDGSGPVRVEVTGDEELNSLELELSAVDDEPVFEVGVSESPPAHAREFIAEHERRERQPETSLPTWDVEQGDRRYFEQTLSTGDSVFVAGCATPDVGDDPDAPVVRITSAGDGSFYLSDRRRADALRHHLKFVAFYFLFGAFLVWYSYTHLFPDL
jgi:hypothetical protein